jgi:hypothetical protein
MAKAFDRDELLSAFDEIGESAVANETQLHLAVYGGSALMLASNFRFSSEDVDVSELPKPLPSWLAATIDGIAALRGWSHDWFNDGVAFHLGRAASLAGDHLEFGSFPRNGGQPGLLVYVPSAEYMLALKLKAVRVLDPIKGRQESDDIRNLLKVVGISDPAAAVEVLRRYFPRSAEDPSKQLFLLKQIMKQPGSLDAPEYPVRNL